MDGSKTLTALQNYDILLCLFDRLQSTTGATGHGGTLASCARVCRTWQEPASYVLWRNLASFHPLWYLLSGRSYSPQARWYAAFWQFISADEFIKEVIEKEPTRWEYFLHRASHVREVGVVACSQSELRLIHALVKNNNGQTILPSLHRLSWRHAVPMDTSLLLLSSPSLHDLEVTISRLGSESTGGTAFATPQRFDEYHIVDPVFTGLAKAAPSLRRFIIAGRQGPGADLVIELLRLTSLLELCIYNQSCEMGPQHLRSIFERLSELQVFFARVVDFRETGPTIHAQALRDLRLQGALANLLGVLSPDFLDTPSLLSLSLRASVDDFSPPYRYIFTSIATSGFARSLRALTVSLHHDRSEFAWLNSSNPPLAFTAVIQPILALQDLEHVDLSLGCDTNPLSDDGVLEIARAWKRLRTLHLSYPPYLFYPPLTSLRHLSDHCPELQRLSMSKLSIPNTLEVPIEKRNNNQHPLHFLNLNMTFSHSEEAGRKLEKGVIAQYIDQLFPNLALGDSQANSGLGSTLTKVRLPHIFSWGAIEQEIRNIRSQRL